MKRRIVAICSSGINTTRCASSARSGKIQFRTSAIEMWLASRIRVVGSPETFGYSGVVAAASIESARYPEAFSLKIALLNFPSSLRPVPQPLEPSDSPTSWIFEEHSILHILIWHECRARIIYISYNSPCIY
jgi:hypothetical protein